MPKEYIEREALIARYDAEHVGPPGRARELMATAPAADVVKVRHGKWIHSEIEDDDWGRIFHKWTCSVCGYSVAHNPTGENYCPHCGAKMGADTQEREGV